MNILFSDQYGGTSLSQQELFFSQLDDLNTITQEAMKNIVRIVSYLFLRIFNFLKFFKLKKLTR